MGTSRHYWSQVQCPTCGAWLRELPDRYELLNYSVTEADRDCPRCHGDGVIGGWTDPDHAPVSKGTPCDCLKEVPQQAYQYFWRCLVCGSERHQSTLSPPESAAPDVNADLKAPGTFPPKPVREPGEWPNAALLTDQQKQLVRECWSMVDSLKTESPIHKVTYIWNLEEALVGQDIDAVVAAARSYVELLDYESVHGKDSGTYYGAEGDVTFIRQHLAGIDRGE